VVDVLPSRGTFDTPGPRAGERTTAGQLREKGYRTAAIGKWHLGSAPHGRPIEQGLDEFFGFYSSRNDYYSHRYYLLGSPPQCRSVRRRYSRSRADELARKDTSETGG
jgi:arylsulfatase A-like enzyme